MSSLARENAILIDWLSFTTTEYSPKELIEFLGMGELLWDKRSGFYGYKQRLWCGSISIHFDGTCKMGVLVEMSGQGCRTYESKGTGDYVSLFNQLLSGRFNVTRLDVAFDEYEGILDIDRLCKDTLAQKYRSVMTYYNVQQSSQGKSIDIGSYKSDVMIRIYDKLAERISKMRSNKDKERTRDEIPHWIRVELQMRDDRATEFIRKYIESKEDIGVMYKCVLRKYLEYGYYRENEEGKRVFCLFNYWQRVLDDAERISLYIAPGVDYNLERLVNYVTNISGNAIDCMFKVFGVEETVKKIEERTVNPSFKYLNIINRHQQKFMKKLEKEKKENESNDSGN